MGTWWAPEIALLVGGVCLLLTEVILIGRGGQGAVTSATLLTAAASLEGLESQGFPFFGAERRGAPVAAFVRISSRPIRRHGMFEKGDVVVLLDARLAELEILERYSLRAGGILIVNTERRDPRLSKLISRTRAGRVFIVNATRIARELGLVVAGWPVVNTAILGAFSRATGLVSLDSVKRAVVEYFGGRLGRFNAEAVERSYRETREVVVLSVSLP